MTEKRDDIIGYCGAILTVLLIGSVALVAILSR